VALEINANLLGIEVHILLALRSSTSKPRAFISKKSQQGEDYQVAKVITAYSSS